MSRYLLTFTSCDTDNEMYDSVLDFCHTALTLITNRDEGKKLFKLLSKAYKLITGDELAIYDFSSPKPLNITPKRKTLLSTISKFLFSSNKNLIDENTIENNQISKMEKKVEEKIEKDNENVDERLKLFSNPNLNLNSDSLKRLKMNSNQFLNSNLNLNSKLKIEINENQSVFLYETKFYQLKLDAEELMHRLEDLKSIKEGMSKDESHLEGLLSRSNISYSRKMNDFVLLDNEEESREEEDEEITGTIRKKMKARTEKSEREKGTVEGEKNVGSLDMLKETMKNERRMQEEKEKISSRYPLNFTSSFKPLPSSIPSALHRNSPAIALSPSYPSGNYDIFDKKDDESTNQKNDIKQTNKIGDETHLFDFTNKSIFNVMNNHNKKATAVTVINENIFSEIEEPEDFHNDPINHSKNMNLDKKAKGKQKLKSVPKTHRESPKKLTKAEMKSPQKNLRTFKPSSSSSGLGKNDKQGNCAIS